MLEECQCRVIPVFGVKPVDEKANTLKEEIIWGEIRATYLRKPIDSHKDKQLDDDLEVPPVDWVGIIWSRILESSGGRDPAGEFEHEESTEGKVEEEEKKEGEVEEGEEGQNFAQNFASP